MNLLVLDKTHHAATDRGLFMINRKYRLRIAPDFTTESTLLDDTLLARNDGQLTFATDRRPSPDRIATHNAGLAWV